MLGQQYQGGRQPDQPVEIFLWYIAAVLLDRVVAWKVFDAARFPVVPARREERVGGAVGESEDRPDQEADNDGPWVGRRPSDGTITLHLVRRLGGADRERYDREDEPVLVLPEGVVALPVPWLGSLSVVLTLALILLIPSRCSFVLLH